MVCGGVDTDMGEELKGFQNFYLSCLGVLLVPLNQVRR